MQTSDTTQPSAAIDGDSDVGPVRKKSLLVGLSLALATVPVMLFLGEGALRFVQRGGRSPQVDRHFFCQFDSELGWANRPNVRCTFKGHPLTINNAGLRDDEPVSAGAGERRLLLLGDSQIFGDGAALDETIGAELERLLPGVRTLNAGAIGYGGDQCLLLFERTADVLRPDLTLLTLNAFDLRDHVSHEIKGGYRKPRFVLTADDRGANDEIADPQLRLEGVASPGAKQRIARWLTQHSRLYLLSTRRGTRPAGAAEREAAAWDSPDNVFPANLDEALTVTCALLTRFCDDAQRGRRAAAVAWLPYEMDYTNEEFRRRSDLAVARLAEHCQAIGLPLCDLRPALENQDASTDSAPQPNEFFLDKLHFSPLGHARIAAALAAWIPAEKLLEIDSSPVSELTHAP